MIWIDTILKHVKTQNENMTKYAKFEQMAHEMLLTEDKAIPRIASSKSSDQNRYFLKLKTYCIMFCKSYCHALEPWLKRSGRFVIILANAII